MIKNERLRISVRIIAVIAFVLSISFFSIEAYSYVNHQKEKEKIQIIIDDVIDEVSEPIETVKEEVDTSNIMGSNQFYDKLKLANPDYIGWIYMPNLKIDFPVVLTTDNAYYLDHGFYKDYTQYGAIFADYRTIDKFDDPHLVIYGHHMKNKSMFSNLIDLRKKENYEVNKIIEIYTEEGLKKYIIFSVYAVDADTTTLDLPLKVDIKKLISGYVKKSMYKTTVDTSNATSVLTLVTCTWTVTNGRLFVHAIPFE